MASYWLKTYATDDIIAKAKAKIISFMQPADMTTVYHPEDLLEKAIRLGIVYIELIPAGIFIEEIDSSIRYSVRTY